MIKQYKLIQSALLISLLGFTSVAMSNSNSGRWYQVEMIVFKNDSVKSENPEQFELSIQPSKPDSYEVLSTSQAPEVSFLDFDFSLLTQKDLDLQTMINEEVFSYEQVLQFFSNSHDVSQLLPKPYLLIESEENALNEHAINIKNSKNMKMIGYQSWQQPIWDKAVYSPIELNFGEQFDNQYEISGWLHLTISRYIHVNPQMYINTFEQVSADERELLTFETGDSYSLSSPVETTASFELQRPYSLKSSIEINETHKTASKQVLYIDHPELAFLFYFTPVELVKE